MGGMMKFGLAIAEFDRTDRSRSVASTLQQTAETAEEVRFTRLVVVDHLWQFGDRPTESAMLEAYTTLGYLAAATARIELLTLVTNPMFRQPGLLAKIVTTLDVLSGGRAWLGIGVGAPHSAAPRPRALAYRSRGWRSASSGSRRRCGSASKCGATTRTASSAGTIDWVAP
jgi:alkanesulfonate monooxygenase SsuD/methylene tetrahydromethanopterin reductase-like flavin-dependent oxidoreductase (luciferase family)